MFGGRQRRKRSVWFGLTVGGLVAMVVSALLMVGLLVLSRMPSTPEEDLGTIAAGESRELPVGHAIWVFAEREDLDPGTTKPPAQGQCTVAGPRGVETVSVNSSEVTSWTQEGRTGRVSLATIPRVAPGADQIRCDGFARVQLKDATVYANSDHGLLALIGGIALLAFAALLMPLGLATALTGGLGLLLRWDKTRRPAASEPGVVRYR